jgi:hypothetical protein
VRAAAAAAAIVAIVDEARPAAPSRRRQQERAAAHRVAIAIEGSALDVEASQKQALFLIEPPLLLDVALDALAHLLRLETDVKRALSRRDRVFGIESPRAFGRCDCGGPIGEQDAAVGGALLVDLRRPAGRCRRSERRAGAGDGEEKQSGELAHGGLRKKRWRRRPHCATGTMPTRTQGEAARACYA